MIKAKNEDLIIRGNVVDISRDVVQILHAIATDSIFIAVKLSLTKILDIDFDEIEKHIQENFGCK